MRARDFLTEAGLKLSDFDEKNDHYWRNLLDIIQSGQPIDLVNGEALTLLNPSQTYRELSSIWDGQGLATSDQISQLKQIKLQGINGKSATLSNVLKTEKIKNKAGVSEKSKFWNLGNVVEGIMGAAVSAKFIAPNKEISAGEITYILKSLQAGETAIVKGKKQMTGYSMNKKAGSDQLTFTMSLNPNDFKALEMSFRNQAELETYPDYQEIIKAYDNAANYVNTSDTVRTAIDRVVNDKRSNVIIIESEGASAEKQTSTKADLFITVDGKRERLLSLKSKSVPQIGQVSGHAFENLEQFFKSVLGFGLPSNFANMFPKGTFKQVGRKIFDTAFPKAYKHIYSSLNKTLGGDKTYGEYNFIKTLYDGIAHHATLGEDVIIVYLSPSAKKAYTELKIGPELLEVLQDFDLVPYLSGATTLKVIGRPMTQLAKQLTGGQDQELVQLRSYTQASSTVRNILEVKGLLKTLADIEEIKKRKQLTKGKPPAQVAQPKTTVQPQNPAAQTPGQFNKNVALQKSKVPMAATSKSAAGI